MKSGSPAALDQALLFFLAVVLVLGTSILFRSYLLNWLGERVVADVVLWIGGQEVLAGRLSGGELSAFVFYAVLVAGAVGTLIEVAGDLLRGAGASERLTELLEKRTAISEPLLRPQAGLRSSRLGPNSKLR